MCIERRSFLEEYDVSLRSAEEHRDDIWEHSGRGKRGGFREYTYIELSELGQTHRSLGTLFRPSNPPGPLTPPQPLFLEHINCGIFRAMKANVRYQSIFLGFLV